MKDKCLGGDIHRERLLVGGQAQQANYEVNQVSGLVRSASHAVRSRDINLCCNEMSYEDRNLSQSNLGLILF